MRPSSKGMYRGWLFSEKVTQDMRLTLVIESEQLLIGLVSPGEVTNIGQNAPPHVRSFANLELFEALPIACGKLYINLQLQIMQQLIKTLT